MELLKRKIEIPEETVSEIAEWLECGMICYLNLDTMEVATVFGPGYDGHYMAGVDDGDIDRETLKRVAAWKHVACIEPPESWEAFKIMEDFVEYGLSGMSVIRSRLMKALGEKKPFRYFKAIVECSECRSQWLDFRHKQMMGLVRDRLPLSNA